MVKKTQQFTYYLLCSFLLSVAPGMALPEKSSYLLFANFLKENKFKKSQKIGMIRLMKVLAQLGSSFRLPSRPGAGAEVSDANDAKQK